MEKDHLTFRSHLNHNPECDILEEPIDQESMLVYGIYVNGSKKGEEFMEYYSGPNYCPEESTHRTKSYSRYYSLDQIPKKWKAAWESLRSTYISQYLLVSNLV